jgi:hypothetical protein
MVQNVGLVSEISIQRYAQVSERGRVQFLRSRAGFSHAHESRFTPARDMIDLVGNYRSLCLLRRLMVNNRLPDKFALSYGKYADLLHSQGKIS